MRNQPPYTMSVLGYSEVVASLDFDSTIEALRQMFGSGCELPPSPQGSYLLLDGKTGRPLVLMGAPTLTARRTAATSALAAK